MVKVELWLRPKQLQYLKRVAYISKRNVNDVIREIIAEHERAARLQDIEKIKRGLDNESSKTYKY